MMRLFLAIEFDPEIIQFIEAQASFLRAGWPDPERRWRWVPRDQFHVTLKFFGETPEASLPFLKESFSTLLADIPEFSMTLGGFGRFGRGRDLQVLWLGVQEGRESCVRMEERINEGLDRVGFKKESRTFHPHITLARAKPGNLRATRPGPLPESTRIGPIAVKQMTLFRSTLTPRGPIYDALGRFRLAV